MKVTFAWFRSDKYQFKLLVRLSWGKFFRTRQRLELLQLTLNIRSATRKRNLAFEACVPSSYTFRQTAQLP